MKSWALEYRKVISHTDEDNVCTRIIARFPYVCGSCGKRWTEWSDDWKPLTNIACPRCGATNEKKP